MLTVTTSFTILSPRFSISIDRKTAVTDDGSSSTKRADPMRRSLGSSASSASLSSTASNLRSTSTSRTTRGGGGYGRPTSSSSDWDDVPPSSNMATSPSFARSSSTSRLSAASPTNSRFGAASPSANSMRSSRSGVFSSHGGADDSSNEMARSSSTSALRRSQSRDQLSSSRGMGSKTPAAPAEKAKRVADTYAKATSGGGSTLKYDLAKMNRFICHSRKLAYVPSGHLNPLGLLVCLSNLMVVFGGLSA